MPVKMAGRNIIPSKVTGFPDFSDEVWEQILSHLTSLDDLRTAVNSHRKWRSALESKRHLWLFPNALPFLTRYLASQDILHLRAVCTPWRQGVDELIQNAEHLAPYKGGRRNLDRDRNPERRLGVWKQTDTDGNFPYHVVAPTGWSKSWPERFFEAMKSHPRNPLVGRELSITVKSEGHLSLRLGKDMSEFLPTFGHHLYYLNVSFPDAFSLLEMSYFLSATLENVPNLRQLRLAANQPYSYLDIILKDGLKALLPNARQSWLKTLQLEFNAHGPVHHFQLDDILIRKYSPSLERLEVKRWDPLFWHLKQFKNLTELSLSLPAMGNDILSSLSQLGAPKLARLCLTFPGSNSDNHPELLQVLQHFPALQSLGILFQEGYHFNEEQIRMARQRPRFPHVCAEERDPYGWMFWHKLEELLEEKKVFFPLIKTLQLGHAPIPLKLMVHFPNVQVLNIPEPSHTPPHRPICRHLVVCDTYCEEHFWDGFGRCYYCSSEGTDEFPDYWMLLPHLDIVTVGDGTRVFRRKWSEMQVQRLTRLTVYDSIFASILQLYLPNVTELELQLGYGRQGISLLTDDYFGRKLFKLLSNLPNLVKLGLSCPNFFASANAMRIEPPRRPPSKAPGQYGQRPQCPSTFPSVREVTLNSLPVSKGFLLHFPKLERLMFDGSGAGHHRVFCKEWNDPILFDKYEPGVSQLQYWGTHRHNWVYESEIWKLFISLNVLTVKGWKVDGEGNREYNRGGYDEFEWNKFRVF